jgi:hypothetical protein
MLLNTPCPAAFSIFSFAIGSRAYSSCSALSCIFITSLRLSASVAPFFGNAQPTHDSPSTIKTAYRITKTSLADALTSGDRAWRLTKRSTSDNRAAATASDVSAAARNQSKEPCGFGFERGVWYNHVAMTIKGTIRGKTIELEQPSGLPDGQAVSVTLSPALPAGEGLRRTFGAWADAEGRDEFLDEVRRYRGNGTIHLST